MSNCSSSFGHTPRNPSHTWKAQWKYSRLLSSDHPTGKLLSKSLRLYNLSASLTSFPWGLVVFAWTICKIVKTCYFTIDTANKINQKLMITTHILAFACDSTNKNKTEVNCKCLFTKYSEWRIWWSEIWWSLSKARPSSTVVHQEHQSCDQKNTRFEILLWNTTKTFVMSIAH